MLKFNDALDRWITREQDIPEEYEEEYDSDDNSRLEELN